MQSAGIVLPVMFCESDPAGQLMHAPLPELL